MKTQKAISRPVILRVAIPFFLGAMATASLIFVFDRSNGDSSGNTSEEDLTSYESYNRSMNEVSEQATDDFKTNASLATPSLATISRLDELDKYRSKFQRNLLLYIALADSDKEQTLDLLEQEINRPAETGTRQLEVILQRLAQISPREAYAQIEKLEDRKLSRLTMSVFNEWGLANLEQAVSFATSLEGAAKKSAAMGILQERSDLSEEQRLRIARRLDNEAVALEIIVHEQLNSGDASPPELWNNLIARSEMIDVKTNTLTDVASAWVEMSGLEVIDQISDSMPFSSEAEKLAVLHSALQTAAKADPEGAFNYALPMTLEDTLNIFLLMGVIGEWAKSDPKSALNAAMGIQKNTLRKGLSEAVLLVWSLNEPHALLEEIDTLPEHLRSDAKKQALDAIADHG